MTMDEKELRAQLDRFQQSLSEDLIRTVNPAKGESGSEIWMRLLELMSEVDNLFSLRDLLDVWQEIVDREGGTFEKACLKSAETLLRDAWRIMQRWTVTRSTPVRAEQVWAAVVRVRQDLQDVYDWLDKLASRLY